MLTIEDLNYVETAIDKIGRTIDSYDYPEGERYLAGRIFVFWDEDQFHCQGGHGYFGKVFTDTAGYPDILEVSSNTTHYLTTDNFETADEVLNSVVHYINYEC